MPAKNTVFISERVEQLRNGRYCQRLLWVETDLKLLLVTAPTSKSELPAGDPTS